MGHNFRKCATLRTPEGRQRLLAKGIDWKPIQMRAESFKPVQPGAGRGSAHGRSAGRVEKRPQAHECELE
jgi:hypothetical protein